MPGPRIVLLRTKESANVGATARAMLNFGLTDLWLVAPRCQIDHRSYALASHAGEVLRGAKVVASLEDALVGMTLVAGTSARARAADNYKVVTPRDAGPLLDESSAVLFGPEDHGLSNEELTRCQLQIKVPTGEFASLNLAQAVLLVAYERLVASSSGEVTATDRRPATRDQLEGFYDQLERELLHIGYTDANRAQGVMRMFRGLLDRAEIDARELAALRGLAAQLRWAADQPPELVPGNRRESA
ncbi:MAG: RNA methyltransferase [Trueperaceae bacterium]|nr:RNA methyltransferase [Trueperaceae bacterium]